MIKIFSKLIKIFHLAGGRFYFLIFNYILQAMLNILLLVLIRDVAIILSNNNEKLIYHSIIPNINNHVFIYIFILLSGVISLLKLYIVIANANLAKHSSAFIADMTYKNLLSKNLIDLYNENYSKVKNRFTYDGININENIIMPFLMLIENTIVIFTLTLSLLIYFDIRVLIVVSCMGLAYYLMIKILKKYLKYINNNTQKNLLSISNYIALTYYGYRDIKLSGHDSLYNAKFNKVSLDLFNLIKLKSIVTNIPKNIVELLGSSLIGILILYSLKYDITLLPTISILAYIGLRYMPLTQQIYKCLASIKVNSNSIHSISNADFPVNLATPDLRGNSSCTQIRSFKLLNISYQLKDKYLFRNFSYEFKAGNTYVITGPSGVGKTTLINIIMGFYKIISGEIHINNIKVSQNNYKYRSKIAHISQNYYFTEGTILDNLVFGLDEISNNFENFEKVLRLVGLYDNNKTINENLATKIAEFGVNLSGGQRQRLAIARALCRNFDVLILDEATNALDYNSENELIAEIVQEYSGKIIVFISHSLKFSIDNAITIDLSK